MMRVEPSGCFPVLFFSAGSAGTSSLLSWLDVTMSSVSESVKTSCLTRTGTPEPPAFGDLGGAESAFGRGGESDT